MRSSVALVAVAAVLFVGGGCGGSSKTGDISSAGGTLVSSDDKFTLIVPPDAVGAPTRITLLKLINMDLPASLKPLDDLGFSYELQPAGLTFAVTSTGELRLTQDEAADYLQDGGVTNVVLLNDEGGEPVYLDGNFTSIDQDTGELISQAAIDHFSYAVASDGIMSFTVKPASITGAVGSTVDVEVTLQGRTSFLFGNYGNVDEARIKEATLTTEIPDFATIDPASVSIDYPSDGAATVTQTFTVTCDSQGDGTMSLYLDRPQTYFFVRANDMPEYTNDSQFGNTIPLTCN